MKNNKVIKIAVAIIFLISGCSFGLAILTRIDEIISAQGELKIIGENIFVKSPFDGTLIEVFVKDGEYVKKGESILKFDDSINSIELESKKENLSNLKENYKMQEEILKKFDMLFYEGAISELSVIQEKKELKNLNSRIDEVNASINKLEILLSKSLIKSPINGTIFDLDITGNNYETLKGERLLGIMPDSSLEAKVFVLNKDIGFIKKNMEVKLKVDSHPYTQFGYLYGKVEKIGDVPNKSTNDLISSQSKYPVFIELQNQYLEKNNEKYILRNGQSITASFKVRKKPFISLFSDVFERITDSLNKIISKKSLFFQNREE